MIHNPDLPAFRLVSQVTSLFSTVSIVHTFASSTDMTLMTRSLHVSAMTMQKCTLFENMLLQPQPKQISLA